MIKLNDFSMNTTYKSKLMWHCINLSTEWALNSEMEKLEIIVKAEELVKSAMKGNDASHDADHAFRVRDLALSLAREEGLASSPDSLLTVNHTIFVSLNSSCSRFFFWRSFLEVGYMS